MKLDCFDLHEDDWGMIDLLPIENLAQAQNIVAEAAAHGEAHRAKDGVGWTAMYIAPEPKVPFCQRTLSLSTLHSLLGSGWQPFASVSSGYSSFREELSNVFAFSDGAHVIYGQQKDGLVITLHLHRSDGDEPLVATLHTLGQALRLILEDLWQDRVIDLTDRAAIAAYVLAEDTEGSQTAG